MYKIHKWSDTEPCAFISQGKVCARQATKITDNDSRIIAEVIFADAGDVHWTEEKEYKAFIADLLMLQEYKSAYLDQQKAILPSRPLNAQEQFEKWCCGKKITWVTKHGQKSEIIFFDHWVEDDNFIDANGEHWIAFDHGFPLDSSGGHWEIVPEEDF